MTGPMVPWAGVQPSARLLPLAAPRLPVLSLPAATLRQQQAGRTVRICPSCHLPRLLSPASHTRLGLAGWPEDGVPHPAPWCLPAGAEGAGMGAPVPAEA